MLDKKSFAVKLIHGCHGWMNTYPLIAYDFKNFIRVILIETQWFEVPLLNLDFRFDAYANLKSVETSVNNTTIQLQFILKYLEAGIEQCDLSRVFTQRNLNKRHPFRRRHWLLMAELLVAKPAIMESRLSNVSICLLICSINILVNNTLFKN